MGTLPCLWCAVQRAHTVLVETIRKSSKVPDHMEDRYAFLRFLKRSVVELYVNLTRRLKSQTHFVRRLGIVSACLSRLQ